MSSLPRHRGGNGAWAGARGSASGRDDSIRTTVPVRVSIDFAIDERDEVAHASTARLAANYRCPQCLRAVDVARRTPPPGFRHREGGSCDGSGVEREAAKRLLRRQVERDLVERNAVRWQRRCPGPGGDGTCPHGALIGANHAIAVWSVVRCDLPNATGLDVAVLRGDEVAFGFELLPRARSTMLGQPEVTAPLPPTGATPRPGAAVDAGAMLPSTYRALPASGRTVSVRTAPGRSGSGRSASGPWGTEAPVLRLALDDVLAFRPLVPTDPGPITTRCEACCTQGAHGATADEDEVSEFLDGAFVAEAVRVQRTWDRVLTAANDASRRRPRGRARRGR